MCISRFASEFQERLIQVEIAVFTGNPILIKSFVYPHLSHFKTQRLLSPPLRILFPTAV